MVKISDLTEYLHADDIEEGTIILIAGKARYISAEESAFGRAYVKMSVKLTNGKTKPWTPNKTTLKKLAKVYGDETDNWIGKQVRLSKVRQNVRGKMQDVLYGEPVQEPTETQVQANPQ